MYAHPYRDVVEECRCAALLVVRQSVETVVGESADFTTAVVRTAYGPGIVVEERPDGSLVVDLVYGRAFLRAEAITGRQGGFFAATSMFQLQRLDRVLGMLAARKLSAEEQAWISDAVVMKCVGAGVVVCLGIRVTCSRVLSNYCRRWLLPPPLLALSDTL